MRALLRTAPFARRALSATAPSRSLAQAAVACVCALSLLSACGPPPKLEAKAGAAPPKAARRTDSTQVDLGAARELDQQGVRAFGEGRYREAARMFEEAHKRGGPAYEIWNMARCQQKLDDLESAARLIERYLEQKNLSPGDRDEARRELNEIVRKPSRVTILTTPPGAAVLLGERRGGFQGRTPLTLDLAPGEHVLTLELAGHETETERVSARYGRSVIVETTLSR